jgi:ribosome-associated protein
MAEMLHVSKELEIPTSELIWRFSRSSGPGGQSVNTSDSRVTVSFDVENSPSISARLRTRALGRLQHRLTNGVLTIAASEHRSQWKNRTAAERRLAGVLADAIAPPPPPRRATRPSLRARNTRMDDKRRRGDVKRSRQGRYED